MGRARGVEKARGGLDLRNPHSDLLTPLPVPCLSPSTARAAQMIFGSSKSRARKVAHSLARGWLSAWEAMYSVTRRSSRSNRSARVRTVARASPSAARGSSRRRRSWAAWSSVRKARSDVARIEAVGGVGRKNVVAPKIPGASIRAIACSSPSTRRMIAAVPSTRNQSRSFGLPLPDVSVPPEGAVFLQGLGRGRAERLRRPRRASGPTGTVRRLRTGLHRRHSFSPRSGRRPPRGRHSGQLYYAASCGPSGRESWRRDSGPDFPCLCRRPPKTTHSPSVPQPIVG